MYSQVESIKQKQEDYINDTAADLISEEKAKLRKKYEQKQTALQDFMSSEKMKVDKKYKQLSVELEEKYKRLILVNNAVMLNMSICLIILCLFSIMKNYRFVEALQDILRGFFECGENYEKLAGSVFFVVVMISIVIWTMCKFGDKYTLYIITTIFSLMTYYSDFCHAYNINFIAVGIVLYIIYGVFRSVRLIEDDEQRMQMTSFVIMLAISIALIVLFFKSMASSFADL